MLGIGFRQYAYLFRNHIQNDTHTILGSCHRVFNAGQRMVAVMAVIASIGLAVTGIIMGFFSGNAEYALSETVLQWSIFVHFCCAGIMAILLPVHIYMAALAPGEGPALRSMFTGFVPEHHIEHHNPLWYEALKKDGRL